MKNYTYQNTLIGKKQLRQLLAWSFTNYDSMQASALADELKNLGFKYASQAGISINIEDLRTPFVKNWMLEKANEEILQTEKIYCKGKITDVERFQKIIDTWSITSESLKEQVVFYFKNYDPLNSVYIMAFSGARGNLSQVRQLVGMRGLISDPSGQIMNLAIQNNFREGLTITDYLMSGYGARKGIIDTALKTANSGYLTRRLIDVAHDILIREKDCFTTHTFVVRASKDNLKEFNLMYQKLLGRVLSKPIFDPNTKELLIEQNTQLTPTILQQCKTKNIREFSIRSPFTCRLYRAICQKCYGWDLADENLVDMGEAIGILAGQSIGEPGTQLTMRTFHTGGIFTSKKREQMISPINGILKLSKMLKRVPLRTNRGEEVFITKNSGSMILIPEDKNLSFIQLQVLKNTILFQKHNQYVTKDTLLGEVLNLNRQIKIEIKPIVSQTGGEIFIPKLKQKVNFVNNNQLIWILSGQFYNSPKNSFTNFYPDYKLNSHNYIFRTKIINHSIGKIDFMNTKSNLYQRFIKLITHQSSLANSKLQKLNTHVRSKNYLLIINDLKYLLKVQSKNDKFYLKLSRNQQIGTLITNQFQTLTGGTLYYDYRNILESNQINQTIDYIQHGHMKREYIEKDYYIEQKFLFGSELHAPSIYHRTIVWFAEEIHQVKCEPNELLVEDGDFISEGFELRPNLFSKTSGIIVIGQKNDFVQTISIKCGFVYEGKKLKDISNKLYYPGEQILSNIYAQSLSFCEHISGNNNDQLLVRPIEIYEVSQGNASPMGNPNANFKFEAKLNYSYQSNQTIKSNKNRHLISNSLSLKSNHLLNHNIQIELLNSKNKNVIEFQMHERLALNNYIIPKLRYTNIESCFLLQSNQFVDRYTLLGYFEAMIFNPLEIVKFKVRNTDTKEILLISNEDCFTIKKEEFPNKKVNDFIVDSNNVYESGKVILSNPNFLTLQKGRPYFFPNSNNENRMDQMPFYYKTFSGNETPKDFQTDRAISLNYFDSTKIQVQPRMLGKNFGSSQIEFSKFFLKKNGKFYRSLIPQFFKKFSISKNSTNLKCEAIVSPKEVKKRIQRTLLIHTSKSLKNQSHIDDQLVLINFLEYVFPKSAKASGLSSITEDYFEEDVNSVFCQNNQFIEKGETIGLLNLEKEITGDIVQGLPRIEEMLEARKKNLLLKRIATSRKKGLLIQKTSLDLTFDFRPLGTPVKENEKINPHKLLKVYFNYYGLMKVFSCDQQKRIQSNRLMQNYEGSYKSFKKVQAFILNSVQSIYYSQGVAINDKHLEVIIKQMTTKVTITYEGNAPLLRGEIIDLYHIQHINKIVQLQGKESAFYIPRLLGITKAALNNPSFISAASFQETTRVLTKAAIEGRMDWLRGLKENIIVGHLIPAGTGSPTYRTCFRMKN